MSAHRDMAGADLHEPSVKSVENSTGGNIPFAKVVKFAGVGTNFPEVTPITSLNDFPAGIVADDAGIDDAGTGQIIMLGTFNTDTSAFNDNDLIYSDSSGDLTTTTTLLLVGQVIKAATKALGGLVFFNFHAASSNGVGNDLTFITLDDESVDAANSRQITAGTNVSFVDAGAGGTLTIDVASTTVPGSDGDVILNSSGSFGASTLSYSDDGVTAELLIKAGSASDINQVKWQSANGAEGGAAGYSLGPNYTFLGAELSP